MLKKYCVGLILLFVFFSVLPTKSSAYLSAVTVLNEKDILKLSDQGLTNIFLDVLIEIQAIDSFHRTSGYSPAEYKDYKNLLRFRYQLKSELQRRELALPSLSE